MSHPLKATTKTVVRTLKKRVFVCSPFRGDAVGNTTLAEALCKEVVAQGHSPLAPHLHFPRFLRDDVERERALGFECAKAWLAMADEVWLYAENEAQLTEGMRRELETSQKFSMPPLPVWMPECWKGIHT